ncbi:MAG TPA: prepilin-type N-terminal cleavage/methylation domain-containing protein [Verrucomicrobiae bacterium]|nr:prepilin-type N-terminal cleavage/methylation domain-containing protein [Verrucomicrobiae bacterium]
MNQESSIAVAERTACHSRRSARGDAGFSLVEIMVAVTLTSVIVLGLMAMFTQTQRAFLYGTNQSDVLEAGRMATDLIVREMEQIAPSGVDYTNNINGVNFYACPINGDPTLPAIQPAGYTPFKQSLPGVAAPDGRENILENLYFVTRNNQTWIGIGYFVRTNGSFQSGWEPVGSLYRVENSLNTFEMASVPGLSPFVAYQTQVTNVSKILDGVVQFTVRAYDINGELITPDTVNYGISPVLPRVRQECSFEPSNVDTLQPGYFFTDNAVPAFVELEIGVLEDQTYQRYRNIPIAAARDAFLKEHAGNVHVFRQRIPIRNVDVTAYQ